MQYKTYNVISEGKLVGVAEYPAHKDNCWWFSNQVWNEHTGFIKSAQHTTTSGKQYNLVEV